VTSWIEVSEQRLASNYRAIAGAVGNETAVLGVIKANAYGHGAERCAVTLAHAGAKWLGVTTAEEGARVRQALATSGFARQHQPQILIMCAFLPEDVAAIKEFDLTPVVWTPEQVVWLKGSGVAVHVEIDTGMARQGLHPGTELDAVLCELAASGLPLDGVFTHFCAAEVAHSELTQTQERKFEAAIAQVRDAGLKLGWVHAGSSSTVDNPAQKSPWLVNLAKSVGASAMVRCGCALYGYCVEIEQHSDIASLTVGRGTVDPVLQKSLRPVMTWKTRVASVRNLVVGESVGYNAIFTAKKPMRLAMIPVGYADGLRRELSGSDARPGGWVILRSGHSSGQSNGVGERNISNEPAEPNASYRAAIVGRVSMNLTMVDITDHPEVRIGDEVVVLGDGITADDHARLAATIPYEILCAVRA